MSFPPPNPLHPGFGAPMHRFPPPMHGLPLPMPTGHLPLGVASIAAAPMRNPNAATIAAPPVLTLAPNSQLLFNQSNMGLLPKPIINADPNKKLFSILVFVGSINEKASDMLIRQLLAKCGTVMNWKRVSGTEGKLQGFGFCEYSDPEAAQRAIRLLHGFMIGDKALVVRIDPKAQEKLNEFLKNEGLEGKELSEAALEEDKAVKKQLVQLLREHEMELFKEIPDLRLTKKTTLNKDAKGEDLSGLDMEDDKRNLIHREIDKFRDTYKKYDKEKEDEKKKKDEDRVKRKRDRSDSRDQDDRPGRPDKRIGSPGDRDSSSPLDEDQLIMKRRQEKLNREKEMSYRKHLMDWESRERRKAKDFEKDKLKEAKRSEETEIEKHKLKQFLQDYDDDKYDSKYYKGRSMERRIQERQKEIERDEYDREQDYKEMEDLKRRLQEDGPDKEAQLLSILKTMNPNQTDIERNESLKKLVDAARNNPSLLEGSRDTAAQNLSAVKTFGFAGMKISSNLEGAGTSANGSNTVTIPPMADLNEDDSNSQQDLRSRRHITVSDVFGNNEEDEASLQNGRKRRPPPNSLLEDSNTDSNLSATGAIQTSALSGEAKRKQIESLIAKIPTVKAELFKYNIEWDLLENSLMERRIKPWINKKITDYIGEEEPSLLDFICRKLLGRCKPEALLREVDQVLDEEAQVFVVKLWRLLIYEIEAKKLGIKK